MTLKGKLVIEGEHAVGQRPSALSRFLGFLLVVVIVIAAAWALRTYVIEPFQIPSASMEETIQTGDMVFTEKVSYHFEEPQPGEIVVFPDPQVPSRVLIKRVIATEGQTVNLIDGDVYVDGEKLDEPYTLGKQSVPLGNPVGVIITYPYTVPDGYVWVMGDNRTNSSDSRYFGPVQTSLVFGKAVMVYWPADHFGWL